MAQLRRHGPPGASTTANTPLEEVSWQNTAHRALARDLWLAWERTESGYPRDGSGNGFPTRRSCSYSHTRTSTSRTQGWALRARERAMEAEETLTDWPSVRGLDG